MLNADIYFQYIEKGIQKRISKLAFDADADIWLLRQSEILSREFRIILG